jgi:hypothetical protein
MSHEIERERARELDDREARAVRNNTLMWATVSILLVFILAGVVNTIFGNETGLIVAGVGFGGVLIFLLWRVIVPQSPQSQ